MHQLRPNSATPCTPNQHQQHPSKCRFLILLLIISNIQPTAYGNLRFPNPADTQSNMWKEQREVIYKSDHSTLYGKDRHCEPPTHVEALKLRSHDDSSWSMMFSRYMLDAGDELDVWRVTQENYNETAHEKNQDEWYWDFLIPGLFPAFFSVFLVVSVLLIPFQGAIAFRIIMISWWIITHNEIKRCGRRGLIMIEKISRSRQRILMPDTVKKPPKSRFHLPMFFRKYPEEDVPSEMESSDEDDEWDGSESEDEKNNVQGEGISLSGLNTETEVEEEDGEREEEEIIEEEEGEQQEEQMTTVGSFQNNENERDVAGGGGEGGEQGNTGMKE